MNMCINVSVSYWLMHMVHQPCWLQVRDRQKCRGLGETILRCLEHRSAGGMGVVFTLFEGTEHR